MESNRRNRGGRRREGGPDRIIRIENRTAEPIGVMELMGYELADAKRSDLKRWLKFGHVSLNGKVTHQFDAPVTDSDELLVNLTRPFAEFKHPRLQLIYEDDDIIVVNKGYGLLSVATDSHKKEETAYDIVKQYVKSQDPRLKVYVVHRLDRHTTGLMMFAKSEKAQDVLRHNWNNVILERLYVAVLEGDLEQDSGFVKSYLMENSRHVVYSSPRPGEGKLAVTNYDVIARGKGYTLAHFSLDTGRKNQIRVHASDMGHPITGDEKYGAKRNPIGRLALHAETLRFAHPVTKKDMHFRTPVPAAFEKLVR